MKRLVASLAGLAALAGCAQPAAHPPLFPLNAGWRWEYVATTERPGGVTREVFKVENRKPVGFGADGSAAHRVNSAGNHYFFRSDASGTYRVASRNEADTLVTLDDQGMPRFVLKQPVAAGTSWPVPTYPYLTRRKLDMVGDLKKSRPVTMHFQVDGVDEAVAVPAGRFEHCVRISGSHTIRNLPDHVVGYVDLVLTQREWYCPQVGMVRFEREEVAARSQLYQGGRYLLELAAVRR